jgi:hypothetical protein
VKNSRFAQKGRSRINPKGSSREKHTKDLQIYDPDGQKSASSFLSKNGGHEFKEIVGDLKMTVNIKLKA